MCIRGAATLGTGVSDFARNLRRFVPAHSEPSQPRKWVAQALAHYTASAGTRARGCRGV